MRNAKVENSTVTECDDKLVREWNTRPPGEGLSSRPLPNAIKGENPALWTEKTLSGEHRRLLLKFLVGKFPMPRQGTRIPRESIKALVEIAKKESSWTSLEVRRVKEIIESLRNLTIHQGTQRAR